MTRPAAATAQIPFGAVLDQLPCGAVVLDASGEAIHTNPVAARWLALSGAPGKVVRHWLQAPPGEQTVRLGGVHLQVQVAPLAWPDSPAAWIVLLHDVSPLVELGRQRARFVSTAAHELRNPITAVKLTASILRRLPPAEWEAQINALTQEADYLALMIEDTLEVSRLQSGQIELEWHQIYLDAFLSDLVDSRQTLAQRQGVSLGLAPGPAVPLVWGDPGRLQQVFTRLLHNALCYTPGGGQVWVRVSPAGREGQAGVEVQVADTGIGIPPQAQPHILEPFYRGDNVRRLGHRGAGLGLTIVKGLVDLHGGLLTLESTPDVGSTFTVWLPTAAARRMGSEHTRNR